MTEQFYPFTGHPDPGHASACTTIVFEHRTGQWWLLTSVADEETRTPLYDCDHAELVLRTLGGWIARQLESKDRT